MPMTSTRCFRISGSRSCALAGRVIGAMTSGFAAFARETSVERAERGSDHRMTSTISHDGLAAVWAAPRVVDSTCAVLPLSPTPGLQLVIPPLRSATTRRVARVPPDGGRWTARLARLGERARHGMDDAKLEVRRLGAQRARREAER